jgi:delta14-sterol reductase
MPPRSLSRTPGSRSSPRLVPGSLGAASTSSSTTSSTHSTHYEFGGPLGASLLLLFLPLLTFALSAYTGPGGWPSHGGLEGLAAHLSARGGLQLLHDAASQWDTRVFLLYCAYWASLAVLYLVLPGRRVQGVVLPTGERLPYPLNGLLSLALVVAVALGAFYFYEAIPGVRLTALLAILPALTLANIAFSTLLSAFLYAYSFRPGAVLLAQGGHTSSPVYNFFIGRELNPRLAGLDLKYFCELRPGLFQWLLLNLACLAQSAEDGGGQPAPAVAAVVAAQVYYVLDALLNEEAILSTMDITLDGFGFMLAFGDLAWVPATYALQARFLVQQPSQSSPLLLACAVAVGALGMHIFRASNSEKDEFKRNPKAPRFAGARTIAAQARGSSKTTLLLADGWWAQARHMNYLGDWLMAVAWSLPCGAASLGAALAWFYPMYFAVLLVHREMRDSEKCSHKYGQAWEEYKRAVPWRIIPGVY